MMDDGGAKRCYGKHRASVVDNVDPARRGRLRLQIPDVLGDQPSTWAEACVPLAGPTGSPMGVYVVPPIGAAVWVEFEAGDPDYPIWSGCRFGSSQDVPQPALEGLSSSPSIVVQTRGRNSIALSDLPGPKGGIILTSASGAQISINDQGITITSAQGAKVELSGLKVSINGNALEVE
jgi:uncharacterized protein involved in type VI secretion and phage assembly